MTSPGWSCAWTACRAGSWPKENRAGMRGSPCSPPSACVMVCWLPFASCQTYSDAVVYHNLTKGRHLLASGVWKRPLNILFREIVS